MSPRSRWLVPVTAVALAIAPVVVATVRALTRGWMAIGDNGLILLRAQDVGTAHHPLLGTWTSASQAAGRAISNPGPLWFDVLAPFVRVAGPRVGLAVAVMLANSAAIVGAAWAAQRAGGQRALVLTTALSAGLAWSMGSELLFDAWQPHAMLLPFWCLLLMCWALAAGHLVMAPFVVGIASLLVQTHLSFVYVVAISGAASVAMVAVASWRVARYGGMAWRRERAALWRMGLASAAVAVIAWIQPLIDQVAGEGNLGHLLRSGGDDPERVGLGLGARFVGSVVALPPWWTRPGFSSTIRPTGVVEEAGSRTLAEGHVAGTGAATLGLVLAVAVLAVVIAAGWYQRSRPLLTLGVLAASALTAALISMVLLPFIVLVPSGVLGVSPHQMRWLWPISALVLLTPLVAVAEWAPVRRVVVPVGLAATAVLSVLNLPTQAAPEGPTADRRYTETTRALVDQLSSYRPAGPVLFDASVLRFAEAYSGPVLAELGRQGVDVVVDDPGMVRQLGERRRADGDEQVRLVILEGAAAEQPPPGARPVAFVRSLGAAELGELDRLRQEVTARAGQDGLTLSDAGVDAARAGRLDFDSTVLAPGEDASALEADGTIAALVVDGYVDLDPASADLFRRYAELRQRGDRQTVGIFELPR